VATGRARGRAVGGAVEGSVIDIVCAAGGAVVGDAVAGGTSAHSQQHPGRWWCCQEMSKTLRVSAVVAAGGSEVPRARQTANALSRAPCESVGDGGSDVSAETHSGFLLSGEVFVWKLPLAGRGV
jgi:hypothetical protein